ncbi:hypothetical protein [Acidihalobacter yilgarnensis]|nr:hypothetical protein [Acidihalobacter yilgarnensis]
MKKPSLVRNPQWGWSASALMLVLAFLVWHFASAAGRTADHYAMDAARDLRSVARLVLMTQRKMPASPAVNDVETNAALALSALRRAAPADFAIISQATVSGYTKNDGNGLEDLASAAKPASIPGLKRLAFRVTGNWTTLFGLRRLLAVFDRYPARITGLDIAQGYFDVTVTIYGR